MKNIVIILSFFVTMISFAQNDMRPNPFLKSSIILKNGDSIHGYTRLASSAFDVRFKDSLKQRREKKIKYKEVEKITTYIDPLNPRKFYFKHTDEDKFLHFVELIHTDTINIYNGASNDLNLFYADSGVDRRTGQEWMADSRNLIHINTFNNPNFSETVTLNYQSSYGYFYKNLYAPNFHIEIERIDYFLQKNNRDKLILVGANGNFMYKNFKKSASKYFEDCPSLVEKIFNKEYELDQLPEVIEYYKSNCN